MKGTFLVIAALAASLSCARAAIVDQWNFNSVPPDANVNTGSTAPSVGNGSAILVGGTTATFVTGDIAHDPAGSTDNSGWDTKSYPAATANNKSAGVRFNIDTTGYTNISVSWYQRNSATASRYARLQYTLDGNNFTDADVIAIYADSVFTNKTANLSTVSGAANNPAFGFRVVSEFESTATGSGSPAYLATKTGSTYGTSGTMRFDMVALSGTIIPGANTPPVISGVSNQTIRVSQSTGALPFTIGDAEDAASSLTLNQASSNPGVVPEANILFGGSGSNRTVSVNAVNQPGSSLLTLYVIDSGGRSNSTTFTVTVLPLNTAPVISSIPGTNTLMNSATPAIGLTIGDLETAATSLALSGSSANTVLVPNGSIVFDGSGSNRTVTLTPAAGQIGVAPITVTVSDGTNSASSVFPLMVVPSASVIFYEPFTYANGSLVTNSGFLWTTRSGTAGECRVTNGQVQITAAQTEDVAGPLIGGPYTKSNSTVLYASFKATFLTLPKPLPGLFAYFANGSTLRGRIYAGTTNAAPGSFRVFVANGSDTNSALATDLNLNTAYTLVTRYNVDTATATLWLNPASESDPGVTASDAQSAFTIAAYGLRQDSDLGATMLIDDLKVGLSFAAVAGVATNNTPIPLSLQMIGGKAVLMWSNPSFSLESSANVAGPYIKIPTATSPYTNAASGSVNFFRLIYP